MPADESNGIVGSHMRYLCNLTVKLRGRATRPDQRRGRIVFSRAAAHIHPRVTARSNDC
jgi:hypothetical protein